LNRSAFLRREDLSDLDLRFGASHGIGDALHPLDGLRLGLHLDDPEARDEFFRFGERPVDDGSLCAGEFDARPLRPRCNPSAARSTPAFTSSSLYLFISLSNCSLGITPASESLSAFTITMNRISRVFLNVLSARVRLAVARPSAVSICTSNEDSPNRHGDRDSGGSISVRKRPDLRQ